MQRYFSILFIFVLLITELNGQSKLTISKSDILSPTGVLLHSQDVDAGRILNELSQKFDVSTNQYNNSSQNIYQYGGLDGKLTEYISQTWENVQWVNSISYSYNYNKNGYVNKYKYFEWDGKKKRLVGTGEYTNYDAHGNYGEETYGEKREDKFEFKDRLEYKYDLNGNLTDTYSWFHDGNDWVSFDWYENKFLDNCIISKTGYSWDGARFNHSDKLEFIYAFGCNDPIPYSNFWLLYGGSPSQWTYSIWNDAVWNPTHHGVFSVNNCGWTTEGIIYETYDNTTKIWSGDNSRGFIYYNEDCGTPKQLLQMDNKNIRLISAEFQIRENGSWVNSERTYISYENLILTSEKETSIPHSFKLEQNSPNPFNPTTVIDFSLSEESDVKLSIFDLSGKLIKILINAPLREGVHSLIWDGKSTKGIDVGAGVYLYNLQTDKINHTKKMILLR